MYSKSKFASVEAKLWGGLHQALTDGVQLIYRYSIINDREGKRVACCILGSVFPKPGDYTYTAVALSAAKVLGIKVREARAIAAGWDGTPVRDVSDKRDHDWWALGRKLANEFRPEMWVVPMRRAKHG